MMRKLFFRRTKKEKLVLREKLVYMAKLAYIYIKKILMKTLT